MNLKTLRSLSLGAIALSRQFGIRITAEQLEQKISRGQIGSERELKKSLSEQSVRVQRLKPKFKTFLSRSYYFPCLAMMRDGTTKIIISCNKNREGLSEIQSIDPLDPTNKVLIEEDKDFRKNWAGSIYLISEETGITSQDRMFDWTWFVPELYRFKGLLALTLIAAIITHILSLAPIVFIQISLDKVLNYGAVSTLYILLIGVCAALIIGGILGLPGGVFGSAAGAAAGAATGQAAEEGIEALLGVQKQTLPEIGKDLAKEAALAGTVDLVTLGTFRIAKGAIGAGAKRLAGDPMDAARGADLVRRGFKPSLERLGAPSPLAYSQKFAEGATRDYQRIINNTNPFQRDLDHLHYLIFNKNKSYYLLIYTRVC